MGQQEVYDFLNEKKGDWFTSKQISDALDISIGSITACLKKLRKTDTISYEMTGNRNEYRYAAKEEIKTSTTKLKRSATPVTETLAA